MPKQRESRRRLKGSATPAPPGAKFERAAGVVGMGLMGTSISACLLAAGHSLQCVEIDPSKLRTARKRLLKVLEQARSQGLIAVSPSLLMERVTISADFSVLKGAAIVVESTIEDPAVKCRVINEIEEVVSRTTLIGSNTSAIPVSDLQRDARHPERILGLHWAEPKVRRRARAAMSA